MTLCGDGFQAAPALTSGLVNRAFCEPLNYLGFGVFAIDGEAVEPAGIVQGFVTADAEGANDLEIEN